MYILYNNQCYMYSGNYHNITQNVCMYSPFMCDVINSMK